MAVIDADAHVVETERTWEYMEEVESPFKPEVVVPKAGGDREYWLIEGRAFAKNTNIGKDTPDEAREVSNITTRLAHMDALAVDVHVLYPTIFLRPLTRRPEAEVALCRSYNRWLAETWRQGRGRLRWVVVPPVLGHPLCQTLQSALGEPCILTVMSLPAIVSVATAVATGSCTLAPGVSEYVV